MKVTEVAGSSGILSGAREEPRRCAPIMTRADGLSLTRKEPAAESAKILENNHNPNSKSNFLPSQLA